MKPLLTTAALGILLTSSPLQAATLFDDLGDFTAATSAALIDSYDNLPIFSANPNNRTVLGSSFSSNGNGYVSHAGDLIVVDFASPFFSGLPGTTVLAANGQEDFTINFGTPGTAVGFDTYFNNLGPLTVSLFGASGLIDTFAPNPGVISLGFLGFTADEAITSMRITATGGQSVNIGIDNLLQGNAIPTPATLSLLALGLIGAARMRRKG